MADASEDPKVEDAQSDATDDDDLDALEAEVASKSGGRGRPTKLSKSEEAKVRMDLQQKLDALLEHSRAVMESMATGKRTVKYVSWCAGCGLLRMRCGVCCDCCDCVFTCAWGCGRAGVSY